jgi:hypothetical protein
MYYRGDAELAPPPRGWRVPEWSKQVGCSQGHTRDLIAQQKIKSIKRGALRIIITQPTEFLAGE